MKNPAHIHIGPSRLGRGSQATCLCKEIVTESVTVHVFDDTPMGEPLVVKAQGICRKCEKAFASYKPSGEREYVYIVRESATVLQEKK
jgi:hypothetical protein